MSASLVGSEMCIRDSSRALRSSPELFRALQNPPWPSRELSVVLRGPPELVRNSGELSGAIPESVCVCAHAHGSLMLSRAFQGSLWARRSAPAEWTVANS
eukprot:5139639-Alexandrium_andersonii.AAC.1